MAIIKRPIPVKTLKLALEKAKNSEPSLVNDIKRYLQRFDKKVSFTHVSATLASHHGETQSLANAYGETSDSTYSAQLQGYYAISDSFLLNAGIMTYDSGSDHKQTFAEGSFLSLGPDYLQLDIGFRPHWFGPLQDSNMLISSNASSAPSVTLSNVLPLGSLNMNYELFYAKMSHSDKILNQDRNGYGEGYPKLLGVHISFMPVDGFALGFNRLMQYGGGDNDESLEGILKAFFNAKKNDNIGPSGRDFGNQLSSITTSYTFPGTFPVAVYMEYAGEDTSASSSLHLGNTSLMLGLHLPKLTSFIDASVEYAQWQNSWYVNSNYGDGLVQNGAIIGHWAASRIGKGIPASATSLKLIWLSDSQHEVQTYLRQMKNESFNAASNLHTAYELSLEYAYNLNQTRIGSQWTSGQDVNKQSYSRLTGFIRW
ncbi:MAG: hypothetical protein HRU20_02315 [Pseudomonadales bacterium]|nr:hypothetical protein [Pseudomonadales bacterium]